MLIFNIVGGLGNQLFQYAFAYAASAGRAAPLAFDLRAYSHPRYINPDGYLLNRVYGIDIPEADRRDVARVIGKFSSLCFSQRHRLKLTKWNRRYVVERKLFQHDEGLLRDIPGTCYLEGWWQTEKNFTRFSSDIRSKLIARDDVLSYSMKRWQEVINLKSNSVSVHIRHGDYATNPAYREIYGLLSRQYYERALSLLRERFQSLRLFVFSDDPAAGREWDVLSQHETHFVTGLESWEDLELMRQCDHHVIANSSFSWWGAWLSASQGLVIAPSKWFAQGTPTADLIPGRWIKVPR